MPELPEVETIARDLNKAVAGKKISKVWIGSPKQVSLMVSGNVSYRGKLIDRLNLFSESTARRTFENSIKGLKILKIARRAKNILFYLSGGKMLLVHPKMTGHLLLGRWEIESGKALPIEPDNVKLKVNNYIRLVVFLSGGLMIGFSDARKFGKILFGDEDVVLRSRDLRALGPEPLEKNFTIDTFKRILSQSKGKVKKFLLDQNKIAGIGNIYSDDILWLSRVHPLREVETLSEPEKKRMFSAIKEILLKAVKHRGTSMSDFRDPAGEEGLYNKHILVYGKKGEPCARCGGKIAKISISGRSASFCPTCQR